MAKAGRKSSKSELKSRKVTLECPFFHLFCHPFNPLQQRNVTEVTLKQEEKTFFCCDSFRRLSVSAIQAKQNGANPIDTKLRAAQMGIIMMNCTIIFCPTDIYSYLCQQDIKRKA
jgi:hypothetical protein